MMIRNNYTNYSSPNFEKKYCWIPKCKARCCANAPLPKHYIEHSNIRNKALRKIFGVIPAPNNNPYCKDAVIPITQPLEKYVIKTNKTLDGKTVWELHTDNVFSDAENYCPFIDEYARCNIYKQRPPVCRDFGVKKGWECDLQIGFWELIKEHLKIGKNVLKEIFSFKK